MDFFVQPQSAILNDYDQSEQVDTGLMKKKWMNYNAFFLTLLKGFLRFR